MYRRCPWFLSLLSAVAAFRSPMVPRSCVSRRTTRPLAVSSKSPDESTATTAFPSLFWNNNNDKPQDVVESALVENTRSLDSGAILPLALTAIATLGLAFAHQAGLTLDDVSSGAHALTTNPQGFLQDVVQYVHDLGPLGPLYFGLIYLVAELLAVPATPLTLSAGYLFGLTEGVGVVLLAATIAASISFVIGKTLLRSWVEDVVLRENPQWAKLDRAIGKEGFQLLLLVRLSPLFPFALSNYLYGASSIDFASYFWGTLLGFFPGTCAYVYTGMVGQALTLGGSDDVQPWYVYAGVLAGIGGLLQLAASVATDLIEALEDEDDV